MAQTIGITLFQHATLTLRKRNTCTMTTSDVAIGAALELLSAVWANLSHCLYGAILGFSSTTPNDEGQADG